MVFFALSESVVKELFACFPDYYWHTKKYGYKLIEKKLALHS